MKYNHMEEWLKSAAPASYNFAEDTQGEDWEQKDYGKIENSYEKYFVYRASLYKKAHEELLLDDEEIRKKILDFCENAEEYRTEDPDSSSKLLQQVYKKLWPEFFEKSYMTDGEGRIASDTMTSAQNRVNKIMQCFLKDKQLGSIYKEKKAYASTKSSIALTAVMGEYFHQKLHTTCPNLKMFLELYHTIGNYCPVPAGFNGARSGNIANYDYWDLTLMKIREWFYNRDDKFNDQLLESQLLHDKGNWKNCKSWLNKFEKSREKNGKDGWHYFIDTLYMQDYVDDNYHVKPFWEGHSWRNIALPDDLKQINKALETINMRIAMRSIRIISALGE